jgi:hypothetical protein
MFSKKYLSASLVAAAIGFGATALHAQGIITGSLTGVVQDSTGAVVPGAVVTATNTATNISSNSKSSGSGEFSFTSLPVGNYFVTIEAPGFGLKKIERVAIETGKLTGLGPQKLAAGQAAQTVEVSTAQSLLETVQSQVTTTFDSEQVSNLPTGGGLDELALLIPGVVSTHGNNRANTNGAGISSNGQRGRSNNFEIDGQSNNDNSVTGPQVFFSNTDALQEIQIITNNFSAQYGRDAGSVINYVTKSGTNQIHGSASYQYEGSWLSSLTQGQKSPLLIAAPHKPRFDNNIGAVTVGGPIIKDKLFGFFSALIGRTYQGSVTSASGTVGGTTGFIPTASGLAALQAAYSNNPGVQSLAAYGPQSTTLPGKVTYLGNPVTINVSNGTTTTPVQVQQYARTYNPHSTDKELLGRLDYQATNKDRFFLRYFYQLAPSFLASGTVSTGGLVNVTDATHSVGADWTHTFGPRVVNQLRYSFQQSKVLFDGGAFPNCTVNSFSTCPSSFTGSTSTSYKLPTVAPGSGQAASASLSSFGLSTSYPQGRIVKDTQIQNNLSISIGKHSITTGGSYEFQNSPNTFLPNISGGYTFYGFNGLLQSQGTLGLAIGSPQIHFTEPDIAAYFQDDYKVTPSLTLNLGMRWEFFTQSINILHNISLANQTGPSPLWSTTLPLSITTFPSVPQDYKHFEPRLGFAYNPSGLKSMVIRGGYAVNIAPAFYNIFLNSYGSAPVVLSATALCNGTCVPSGGANYTSTHALDNSLLLPASGSTLNPGSFNQTFVGANFRQPTTQTYSLGVQQEIGRIAVAEVRYVGSHTFADFQSVNGNPAVGAALKVFPNFAPTTSVCATAGAIGLNSSYPVYSASGTAIANPRLSCAASNVRIRTNTAFEIYNGLQTSINSRAYHGVTANFSYTFSRTIDNASEIFGTNGAGDTVSFAQNPLDTNVGERGVSGQSYPNVTSLGFTYVDPHFQHNHTFVGKAFGGFQLNTIYVFNSGQPYTPYQAAALTGNETNFCDYLFDATFAGPTTCRPVLSNPSAPLSALAVNTGNGIYKSFQGGTVGAVVDPNTQHFIINNVAEAITKGTPFPGIGRNTFRGNSYNNADVSIYKNNQLSERFNLQLQATFFNALNRAYYGAPDAQIEDAGSTFGNFTGNAGNSSNGPAGSGTRNVQVGARLLF